MITIFFFKTSKEIGGDIQTSQAVVVSFFSIFVYVTIAYITERLSKRCFIWREHFDKSFKKWLKIFETFPEGVTMLNEDGSILYTNGSMKKILEHPEVEQLKKDGALPASTLDGGSHLHQHAEDRQISIMGNDFVDRGSRGRSDSSSTSDRGLFEQVRIKKW